jgi:hypothetical protein
MLTKRLGRSADASFLSVKKEDKKRFVILSVAKNLIRFTCRLNKILRCAQDDNKE